MPKIYFFDIDNTLLDHQTFRIPDSALHAISELKQEGHTIVVATGRSYEHALPFIKQIAPSYAITQNGARIQCADDVVFSQPLPREKLLELFIWISECGYGYGINHGDEGFISKPIPEIIAAMDSVHMRYQSTTHFYRDKDVYQAWLFFPDYLDSRVFSEILVRFPEFSLVRWHPMAVDVMCQGLNKWVACQWIFEQTGFTSTDAIAFGDGLNDMEMIQGVGLGVAMGNAHPDLKAVAQYIAPALHLDGIAEALTRLKAGEL